VYFSVNECRYLVSRPSSNRWTLCRLFRANADDFLILIMSISDVSLLLRPDTCILRSFQKLYEVTGRLVANKTAFTFTFLFLGGYPNAANVLFRPLVPVSILQVPLPLSSIFSVQLLPAMLARGARGNAMFLSIICQRNRSLIQVPSESAGRNE